MNADDRFDPLRRLVANGPQPAPTDSSHVGSGPVPSLPVTPAATRDARRPSQGGPVKAGGEVNRVIVAATPLASRGGESAGRSEVTIVTPDESSVLTQSRPAPPDVQLAAADGLDALAPIVERARMFAERWDAPYRPEIFRLAMERLVNRTNPTAAVRVHGSGAKRDSLAGFGGGIVGVAPGATALLNPTEKLARQIEADPDAVDRVVQFEDGGKVVVLARIEAKTRRELQIKYGLVHLYIKEIALGARLVDIDELRAVCLDHGCYDQNNFTGNYKKAQQDGLMREQPTEKGSRSRRYVLTQKGMNEAAALMRELVLQ